MPLDNSSISNSSNAKAMAKNSKVRTTRLSSLAEDIPEDAPFRSKLHVLFSQIEKEFELLYLENLSCKFINNFNNFT